MLTPGNILLTTTVLVLILGGKKIRSLGEDLGVAIRSFREAMSDKPKQNAAEKTQVLSEE